MSIITFVTNKVLLTKKKPPPVFCKYCGKKLVPDQYISGYNEYTGEAINPFTDKLICPNNSKRVMSQLIGI